MWGCESWEMVLASRSKRWRDSGEDERCAGRTLIATVRSSLVSRAFQTSPIHPAPRGARTSYGPSRLPADTVISDHKSQFTNHKSQFTIHQSLSRSLAARRLGAWHALGEQDA